MESGRRDQSKARSGLSAQSGRKVDGSEDLLADSELSLSQIELIERIRWLINLRWLAFLGVVATILIARAVFVSYLPWRKLLLTAFAIPLYNTVILIYWRRTSRCASKHLELISTYVAHAQIVCDLVVLGALIHLSGGIENLFGFYLVFHMVIASFLLSRRAAFAQATVALAVFCTVAVGEYTGLLPHYVSPIGVRGSELHSNGLAVFAAVWVMSTSLYVTVYLATSIASRLRQREDQVYSLSRRIQYHADALQVAYDKLAAIERAKSAYTRKVAHELRSPLAAIDSLLRTVADGLQGAVSEQARDTVQQARRRARELLALVKDLLSLAAAREAETLADWEDVDVRAILEDVVRLLSANAEARNIKVNTLVEGDIPRIRAIREGLLELVTNLVSNAIKYSYDGAAVDVRLAFDGAAVIIQVSDTGVGIDTHDLKHVFEEFYRAENAREFTSEGTGLGLSIVKSIVDAHSGSIEVESKKGEGTTFTVRLPVRGSSGRAQETGPETDCAA